MAKCDCDKRELTEEELKRVLMQGKSAYIQVLQNVSTALLNGAFQVFPEKEAKLVELLETPLDLENPVEIEKRIVEFNEYLSVLVNLSLEKIQVQVKQGLKDWKKRNSLIQQKENEEKSNESN